MARVITRRSRDGQAAKAAQAGSRDCEAGRNLRIFKKNKSPVVAGRFACVRVVLIAFNIIIALILKEHKLLFVFKISNYF